jgi:hypothetical protein
MRAVDEYLRHGVSTRRLRHGLAVIAVCLDIELFPFHPFFLEERLRPSAKRAPARCV